MRLILILALALLMLCAAPAVAQSSEPARPDTLAHYIQQRFDSIKLDLQKAESQSLAVEARDMRAAADRELDWVVKMLSVLVALITIIFGISGFQLYRSQRQLREAKEEAVKSTCDDVKKDLKPQVESILAQIDADFHQALADSRSAVDEKVKGLTLPLAGQPISEDDLKRLREVDDRLRSMEQRGGRLSAGDYVLRARKLLEDKLFDLALAAYNDAITEDTKNAQAWFGRGYCLCQLDRNAEAIQAFDTALKIKPDFHQALYNKAYCLDELGRYEDAIQANDAAFKISPAKYKSLNNKGNSLARLGRYEEALQAFDDALKFNPEYPEGYFNKGVTLLAVARYEEAVQSFDTALKIEPRNLGTLYFRASAYAVLLRKTECLTDLKLAIDSDNIYKAKAKADEAFKAYWDDDDFKNIIAE